MDIKEFILKINPDLLIFLLASLFGFITWIVKGLVEKPLIESKNTFNKFLEKRIEILTEVKVRLKLIAYFPKDEESKEYKEQLQQILLKDGKTGYLNKESFEAILRIAIDPKTNEDLLLKTIKEIDEDLFKQISKVQDEVEFFRKFSNYNPLKRFAGFSILSIQYAFALSIVIVLLFLIIYGLIFTAWYWKIAIGFITIATLFLTNKWIK